MKQKFMFLSIAALLLTACGNATPESSSQPAPGPQKDPNEVSVFLLSGQSNMQGNSSPEGDVREGSSTVHHNFLEEAFDELGFDDYEDVASGIKTVKSSVYCAGYGELDHTKLNNNSKLQVYTNKEAPFDGLFVDTVPGLGNNNKQMGPELGLAYALKEEADEDHPIFLVKMASNGSGFEQSGTQYNWPVKDADGNFPEINLYNTFAKPFLENNLKLIKDMGLKPVIKGWVWHQGESDSAEAKIKVYGQRLGDMVAQFREDFAEYARDEDGDNIAFIDGMIYQGENTSWGKDTSVAMNEAKQAFADSADNNYIVDIYGNADPLPENELKPGSPGGDSMHYNTKSSLRLGMAYGQVIIDNDLLD